MEETLDRVKFASRIVNLSEPTKSEIGKFHWIVHVREQRANLRGYHKHRDHITITDGITEILVKYENILSISASDYKHSLRRALSLLRLGVETDSDYLKYAAYWNSLEQFVSFLSNARTIKEKLIEAQLYVIWKETNTISIVNDCLDNIFSIIKNSKRLQFRFNIPPQLKDWRKNRVLVIKYRATVSKIWKEEQILGDDIKRLETLIRVDSQENYRNIVRKMEFRVAMLYQTRNLLFHEGKSPSLLGYYARILQEVLLDLILAVFVINMPRR